MNKKTMKKLEKKIEAIWAQLKTKDYKKHTYLINGLSLLDIHWF